MKKYGLEYEYTTYKVIFLCLVPLLISNPDFLLNMNSVNVQNIYCKYSKTLCLSIYTYIHIYIHTLYIQAYLILLHFTLLNLADTVFFYKLKICCNPALSDDGQHLPAMKYFYIKLCTLFFFFQTYAIAHLIDITFRVLGNQKFHVTHFQISPLLWWSGTEPTISPR